MLRFRDAKLGRVLAFYASGAFAVLQAIDMFQDQLDLPAWTFTAALVLLIVGLPVIITTAFVQTHDFKSRLVEKHFTWRRSLGAGALAFAILLTTTGYLARDRFGGSEKLDANLVAVFPFRVNGVEPSLSYLSEGMVDLLAAKIDGASGMRAAETRTALAAYRRVDSKDAELEDIVHAARRIGARNVLVGEIVGTAAQLTINAALTNTRTGRRVQHSVTGPADSLTKKVDELVAVLLSLDAGEPRDRLATLTTTSLPALHSYLTAEAFARHADHVDAMRAYAAALEADSTFALAALGMVVQATWGGNVIGDGAIERARRLAWQGRERLSELDRLKLTAYVSASYPIPNGEVPKCKVWKTISARAPDRAEAWHNVGDCYYHDAAYMGVERWQEHARINFEKSLALDSTFLPNVQHLIPLAAMRRDLPELRRLTALAGRQDARASFMKDAIWYEKYLEGRPRSELVRVDSLVDGQPNPAYLPNGSLGTISQILIRHTPDAALADTLLGIAMARGRASANGDVTAGTGVYITMLRGQHKDALRYLSKMGEPKRMGGAQNVLMAAMYGGLPHKYAAPFADVLERRISGLPEDSIVEEWRNPLCVLEQWRLWKGDASHTDRALNLLRAPDPDPGERRHRRPTAVLCAEIVEAIRATIEKKPHATALALRLDSLSAEYPRYAGLFNFSIRMTASRLLELNGRTAEARVAVRRMVFDFFFPYYLGDQLLQDARLSAKLGHRDEAVLNYRRYLALRTNADSTGQVVNQQVRHELGALTGERETSRSH